MSLQKQIVTKFDGGISQNSKTWLPNAARFTRNLAVYDDSDSCSLNPIPIKDSASTVTGLVKWIVDANPYNTNRYAYDDAGNIYQIASNVWSNIHTATSSAGQGMCVLSNTLFYACNNTMGRYYYLDNSPSFSDDFTNDDVYNLDLTPTGTVTGNTYALPTAVSENVADTLSFTPTTDPLRKIEIFTNARGTGNWTLVVHDRQNNVMGTITVANASLTNTAYNTWNFTTPIRINIGQTYHFHLYSSVNDGTARSGTSNSLPTVDYKTFFQSLVTDSDYHPIIQFTNGVTGTIVFGNEHYLGQFDMSTYSPNKIVLEPGFKVRGLAKINNYVMAYAWRGSNIDSFEEGRIYIWDGISKYYNDAYPVDNGLPNAMIANKNRIFSVVGSNGALTIGNEPFKKLQVAPKLTKGKKIEVLPGAITNWQGRVLFGYSNTDDSAAGTYNYATGVEPLGMEQGVYEFGSQSDKAISYTSVSTESLTYAYSPSTAIANPTSFKIGCVAAFGKDLYISYKDGSTYYVDRISKTNNPQANGSWQSLIIDEGLLNGQIVSMPEKQKSMIKLVITFAALTTGCTVTPKYRFERAANWTLGTTVSTVGATRAEVIGNGTSSFRYRECEVGFDLAATTTFPFITGVYFEYDANEKEVDGS